MEGITSPALSIPKASHPHPSDLVQAALLRKVRNRKYYLSEWDDADIGPVAVIAEPPKFKHRPLTPAAYNRLKRNMQGWRLKAESSVYFIRERLSGAIKIGIARDVVVRLTNLQGAHPYPLQILGICPGGLPMEMALHAEFASQRLAGEWFLPSPVLRDRIMTLCQRPKGGRVYMTQIPQAPQSALAPQATGPI
jgi:hypothetical protein